DVRLLARAVADVEPAVMAEPAWFIDLVHGALRRLGPPHVAEEFEHARRPVLQVRAVYDLVADDPLWSDRVPVTAAANSDPGGFVTVQPGAVHLHGPGVEPSPIYVELEAPAIVTRWRRWVAAAEGHRVLLIDPRQVAPGTELRPGTAAVAALLAVEDA